MNEVARQCRVKAEVYAEGAEDTYLYPLLMDAADTIEVLEEKVKALLAKTGLKLRDIDDIASLRFDMKELRRRVSRLETARDVPRKSPFDDFDSFLQ